MTTRHADGPEEPKPTFDPEKRYEYTWPGCKPQIVGGAALTHLVKGADPSMLAIREVTEPSKVAPSIEPAEVDPPFVPVSRSRSREG